MSVRGYSFAVTGKMSRSRREMERSITEAGGRVEQANRADLASYIVVGKRPGGVKLNAGHNNYISENDLWRMMREDDFRPSPMSRTDAVLYADTLNDHGQPMRPFTPTVTQVTSSNQVGTPRPAPAAAPSSEVERFSIADFFEDE